MNIHHSHVLWLPSCGCSFRIANGTKHGVVAMGYFRILSRDFGTLGADKNLRVKKGEEVVPISERNSFASHYLPCIRRLRGRQDFARSRWGLTPSRGWAPTPWFSGFAALRAQGPLFPSFWSYQVSRFGRIHFLWHLKFKIKFGLSGNSEILTKVWSRHQYRNFA